MIIQSLFSVPSSKTKLKTWHKKGKNDIFYLFIMKRFMLKIKLFISPEAGE
jgi:hypothetical protein